MKMKHILTTAFTIFCIATPAVSQAYEVTDSQVTRLSDTVTMYTLTYEFGFLNADVWLPVVASRSAASKSVGYESAATKSHAMVLSRATITDDNMYFVPKGERASFTLLVLEEHTGPATKEVKQVRVTRLPLTMQKIGDEKITGQLREAELEKFVVRTK